MKKIKELDPITAFSIGFAVHATISTIYPFVFSPFIVAHFANPIKSFLFLSLISILLSYMVVFIYDKLQVDWLRIESLKEAQAKNIEHDNKNSRLVRMIVFWTKKSKKVLFTYLIFRDPIITILYYRKGSWQWDGINDSKIFLLFLSSVSLYNASTTGIASVLLHWLKLA